MQNLANSTIKELFERLGSITWEITEASSDDERKWLQSEQNHIIEVIDMKLGGKDRN